MTLSAKMVTPISIYKDSYHFALFTTAPNPAWLGLTSRLQYTLRVDITWEAHVLSMMPTVMSATAAYLCRG